MWLTPGKLLTAHVVPPSSESEEIIELSVKSIKTGVFDQSFAKLMVAKHLLLFSYNSNFRNT